MARTVEISSGSLVLNHTLNVSNARFTGSQTSVGTSASTVSGVTINGGGSNYIITFEPGKLTVTGDGGTDGPGPGGPGGGGGDDNTDIQDNQTPLVDFLDMSDHSIYIKGYPDKSVRPNNPITRAEVATVFYRLLLETYLDGNAETKFSDVPQDAWYSLAIATLTNLGILKGYDDGTFKPNNPITRAEFATVAARFDKLTLVNSIAFNDVPPSHWAVDSINSAFAKGWINGYTDGTFRPSQNITRAEVTRIVNTMLNRLPTELPESFLNPYNDIVDTHWAYIHMMEASTFHDYERDEKGIEFWTMHICPVTGEELKYYQKPDVITEPEEESEPAPNPEGETKGETQG